MKEEEKAKELVDKYSDRLGLDALGKPAALICIDEKIGLYNRLMGLGFLKDNAVGFELADIKKHIELL